MADAHRLVRVAPNVTRHAVLVEAAAFVRRLRLDSMATAPTGTAYRNGVIETCDVVLTYLEAEAAKALDG